MHQNRRFRRIAAWTIVTVFLLTALGCADGEQPRAGETKQVVSENQRLIMGQMNQAAEEAYQSVKAGDLEKAKTHVEEISVLSTRLSYEGIATLEGMQAVTQTITEAIHSLNSVAPEPHKVSMSIAKTRLTVDALAHRDQPMWLGFRKPLAEDLKRLEEAAAAKNTENLIASVEVWKGHVSLVHPAIIVSRGASAAVKLDSITAFLENSISASNWNGLNQAMPNLLVAMEDVFRSQAREQEAVAPMTPTAEPPHPVIWSLALGSFIVIVLTYVAWRRYRADQGVSRVKREKDIGGGV